MSRHCPLHVTLRMVGRLPSLRSEVILRELRRALGKGKERFGLRVDGATLDALLATTGGVPMRVADALHRMATGGRSA